MEPRNTKRPGVALIVIVLASIAGLWSIDVFLARLESAELKNEARRHFENGTRLLNDGQAERAIDLLRKAYALDRANSAYSLRLAAALIAGAKLDDAQRLLTDILERSPNDGETNLIEARLMARTEKFSEASADYHRAIYGIWSTDTQARRVEVRLELAAMLAARGSQKDLLAELLPLESDAPDNVSVQRQVGRLYLSAGAAARAEGVFRALIRGNANDSADYAGLGDAELAVGDYRAAEGAFDQAIRKGGSGDLKTRVELAARMAALDPTVRRLSSMEKFTRSLMILQLARDALAGCAATPEAKDIVASADQVLAKQRGLNVNNALAEERLSMAERVWTARIDTCGVSTAAQEEPLRLIMVKLAQ
jgi:tetratricopeptide (TPR) repeat protein